MLPPLTWVTLAFLVGLIFAEVSDPNLSVGLISLAGFFVLWVVLALSKRTFLGSILNKKISPIGISPIILAMFYLLGVVRFQLANLPITSNKLAWYNDKGVVTITGVISGYPDKRDAFQLLTINSDTIALGSDASSSISISGKVIVRTGINLSWGYGDKIQLIGKLSMPADEADFSYKDYLARKSILSSLYYPDIILIAKNQGNPLINWIYTIRSRAITTLSGIFPAPESALLAGILLGFDNEIPPDIQTAFQRTGTTHIIAISGFNISILAALFSTFFYRILGIRKGVLATIITLSLYVILAGANPSVVRAAIMGSLGLFASLIGRKQNGINSLAFVGALMCLINPFLPWDISFQLSFLSTLGLILFAEPMVEWVKRLFVRLLPSRSLETVAENIGEYFLFTLAALIMTFPVMAYHFHTFSWLSFLTNPLILPAQPAVMVLGGLSLLTGMLWHPLGQAISYLAWPFVAYTINIVSMFGHFTGPETDGIFIGIGFIAFYYAVLVIVILKNKGSLLRRILRPNLIILLCGAIVLMIWRFGMGLPDGNLHIYVIDNGPSENILIRSPGGRYLMINAGSQSSVLADALGKRLPPGKRQLDLAFLPLADKLAIRSFIHGTSGIEINKLVWLGDPGKQSIARELEESGFVKSITNTIGFSKLDFPLGAGVFLELNLLQDNSGVFFLQWEKFSMLIPVGVNRADWINALVNINPDLSPSVIVLAGDGSTDLNPVGMINRINPSIIIINSNPINPLKTIPAIYRTGNILSTSYNGWIHIATDGNTLWAEAARSTE